MIFVTHRQTDTHHNIYIIIIIILPGDLVTRSSKLFPVVATDGGSAKGALFRIITMITMVKLVRRKWKETKEQE